MNRISSVQKMLTLGGVFNNEFASVNAAVLKEEKYETTVLSLTSILLFDSLELFDNRASMIRRIQNRDANKINLIVQLEM